MTIYSVNCVLQLFVSQDCSITIFLIITINYFTGYKLEHPVADYTGNVFQNNFRASYALY